MFSDGAILRYVVPLLRCNQTNKHADVEAGFTNALLLQTAQYNYILTSVTILQDY